MMGKADVLAPKLGATGFGVGRNLRGDEVGVRNESWEDAVTP